MRSSYSQRSLVTLSGRRLRIAPACLAVHTCRGHILDWQPCLRACSKDGCEMGSNHSPVLAKELQAALSRCNLSREPWSQALLLLLETVDQQSSQIRGLEDIVAADAFGADYNQAGVQHTPTSLAVSLAHGLQTTRQQVQQLQDSCAVFQQQQELASDASKCSADHLHRLEQRMQQLEQQQHLVQQQIGVTGRFKSIRSSSPALVNSRSGSPALDALQHGQDLSQQAGAAGAQAHGSVAARLLQLEHQVVHLSESASDLQERSQAAASAVRLLDDKLSRQLSNIRTDTKQAITVATSVACGGLKAEIHADMDSKARENERSMKHELAGVVKQMESTLGSARVAITSKCNADFEARLTVVQDAQQQRIEVLQQQLDRLAEDKADMRLLTQYTQQVNDVFEQLSVTLVDSTQASIADLASKHKQLTSAVHQLSANKADCNALLQLQQQCQQQVEDLHCALAAAQQAADEATAVATAAKRAAEPVAGLRLDLADTQGAVTALQAGVAGLSSASNSHSSQLQDHTKQLQRLGTNHHMLQQQLFALTNQIDPAAAAVLAAAAAGNDDATAICKRLKQCRGSGSTGDTEHNSTGGSTAAEVECSNSTLQSLLFEDSDTLLVTADDPEPQLSDNNLQQQRQQQPQQQGASRNKQQGEGNAALDGHAAEPPAVSTVGVMRHMPVTMRLCLLENSVQEVRGLLATKAQSGDLAGLTAQVEQLSSRLKAVTDGVKGVSSSSIKHLEEQCVSFTRVTAALSAAVEEKPSSSQVHELMQQYLADANQAATASATTAGRAAVAPLQQQLQEAWVELEAAKGQLAAAQLQLSQLSDWKADLGDPHKKLQQQLQQLRQQITQQLQDHEQQLQRRLETTSKAVAADTVKQLVADQAASDGSTPKQLAQRVSALDTKLKIMVAEVDRLEQQAAAVTKVQGQHNKALEGLETALTSHISQCTTAADTQQQHQHDLLAALQDCQQSHDTRLVALESAAKGQATAVSELAGLVAALPSKDGIKEAVVEGSRATSEALLQEHKQDEEQRWEVWLSEFARALEQRPTKMQLEQQLTELRKALGQAAEAPNGSVVDAAVAKAIAEAMDEASLTEQVRILDMRIDTLEEALRSSLEVGHDTADAAEGAGAAAGQLAVLLHQLGDVQLQLLSKADKRDVQQQLAALDGRFVTSRDIEQQLQQLKKQLLQKVAGLAKLEQVHELVDQQLQTRKYVSKRELEMLLEKKLDIEAFLASVAARRCAVVS